MHLDIQSNQLQRSSYAYELEPLITVIFPVYVIIYNTIRSHPRRVSRY